MGVSGGGGGGGQSSAGYDYSRQLQQSLQSIWGPQAAALSGMYGQTTNLMNQQMQQVPGAAMGAAANLMPGASGSLGQMGQYADTNSGAYAQARQYADPNSAAYAGLRQFADPNSALAQSQLADYSQQVGQNFNREILPGIRSGAGITGNMGGSRAALAQGVAGGDAATAIAQGGRDIYAHQYDTAATAAGMIPQLASQMAGLIPQMGASAAGQMPGMASQIYNLAMAPYASMWAPLTSAAGIFGGPTALSASQGQTLGESWNAGMGAPTKPSYGFNLF